MGLKIIAFESYPFANNRNVLAADSYRYDSAGAVLASDRRWRCIGNVTAVGSFRSERWQ